ncbi:hypothetical protein ACI3ST_29400, partial [Klebsiella pneumoniae]
MNKINYQIKYIEYLLRKCRTILTNDISFHADRLREISGTYPDLLNPVTLNEKICHRILFIHNPFYTLLADKLLVRQYVEKRTKEGANKQVISSQADSLIKISRIWADFFPANTSN